MALLHASNATNQVTSLDGSLKETLARVDGPPTGFMVSRYHVHTDAVDRVAVPVLERILKGQGSRLCVLDEIAKMMCSSSAFVARARALLQSRDPELHVLASVAVAGNRHSFIEESKRLTGVELVEFDRSNREATADDITERLKSMLSCQTVDSANIYLERKIAPRRDMQLYQDPLPELVKEESPIENPNMRPSQRRWGRHLTTKASGYVDQSRVQS